MLLHYYSFYRGESSHNRKSWTLDDIKLPAPDPRSAIILDFFMSLYLSEINSPWSSRQGKGIYIAPNKMAVTLLYRTVIEYDRIERHAYGRTLVQFKKIHEYSQWYIQSLFDEAPWNNIVTHYNLSRIRRS